MSNPLLKEAVSALDKARSSTPFITETLQYPDVIVTTSVLFAITVISAAAAWVFLPANGLIMIVLTFAALGVAIAAFMKKTPGPTLPLLYAVLEGGVVGIISAVFALRYGTDIVVTAVIATAVVFAACLIIYRIPAVRASSVGRRFFLAALIGYLALSIISLIAGMLFGVGGGWGFYGLGWLGIGIAVAATLISAWSLVIDFNDVDIAVTNGAPVNYRWTLALGLLISTIWLYLTLLRTLGLIRR